MKFWKPAGAGCFQFGEWTVRKDWSSGLWDVWRGDTLIRQNLDDAPAAMKVAEEKMSDVPDL